MKYNKFDQQKKENIMKKKRYLLMALLSMGAITSLQAQDAQHSPVPPPPTAQSTATAPKPEVKILNKKAIELNTLFTNGIMWDIEGLQINDEGTIKYMVYLDDKKTTYRGWEFKLSDMNTPKLIQNEGQYLIEFSCLKDDCIKVPPSTSVQTHLPKKSIEVTMKDKKTAEKILAKLKSF